jgi:hypothetical protein
MTTQYAFLTTWLIRAEREAVWDVIDDVLRWPQWWQGVQHVVELEPGDDDGVGGRHRIEWRARLPYPIEFEFVTDRVERPRMMEGRAFGELEGTGVWRLWEERGLTAVVYDWEVATTKPWMNLLAPLMRAAFAWNHSVVMRRGGQDLARHLGVRLLSAS